MKKIITLSLFIVALSTNLLAQIPNGNFESWTGNNLNQWSTSNQVSTLSGVFASTPGTPAPEGNTYLSLTTYLDATTNSTMPAYAICGNYDFIVAAPYIDGFPYSSRPEYVTGQYKYASTADMGAIVCYLTKWNTTTNARDTVGVGQQVFNPMNDWTNFNMSITYNLSEFPDSCVLGIISSIYYPAEQGATISMDALNFTNTPLEVLTQSNEIAWNIFPNPVENTLNFTLPSTMTYPLIIHVMDGTGKLVKQQTLTTSQLEIHDLKAGVYFIQIQSGNQRLTKSFVKK